MRQELTHELYKSLFLNILSTFLIAVILFLELINYSSNNYLVLWFSVFCFILVIRTGLYFWHHYTKKTLKFLSVQYYSFVVFSTLTAILWGVLGSYLMPNDTVHQTFILIIVSGILAGAVQSLSSSYLASMLYVWCSLFPILIWELMQIMQGMRIFIGIFTLMFFYCIYSSFIAYRNYKMLATTIKLKNENMSLVHRLTEINAIVKQQAIHDVLTGLFNRLYLSDFLPKEMERSQRSGKPLSVIMIDIDHFKHFNDTYGHDAGDEVLKELGSFLSNRVRGSDIACRFGGEEFILVLPEITIEAAAKRAEKLRQEVKNLRVRVNGKWLDPITLSFGIAEFPKHGANMKELIDSADRALYQAKNEGRDCIRLSMP